MQLSYIFMRLNYFLIGHLDDIKVSLDKKNKTKLHFTLLAYEYWLIKERKKSLVLWNRTQTEH